MFKDVSNSDLKDIAKKYHLSFDKKFKYCISDAYYNDKGDFIPSYFYLNSRVFTLKYVDGSFNPFLYEVIVPNGFGVITNPKNSCEVLQVVRVANRYHENNLQKQHGANFSMI